MRNLFHFFLVVFLTTCLSGYCSENKISLDKADSLFKAKKYTESFQIYENLDEGGISTPAMYLKMAYIKEALNDLSGSLYYLNKYYHTTYNSKALKKMETLSEEKSLQGYAYSDFDFFRSLLYNYADIINYSFLLIFAALFLYIFFKIRKGDIPQISIAFFFVLLICFLVNFNFKIDSSVGVVNHNNIFLMDGPSAGSNPVEFVNEGHRVNILKEDGAWYEVMWQGEKAFVRKTNLFVIKKEESPVVWLLSRIKQSAANPA